MGDVLQGTLLKEAVGADLEAMGSHEALNSASDKANVPPWACLAGTPSLQSHSSSVIILMCMHACMHAEDRR
jgi:hypothetical protein